jgi:hypothetical protein
MASKDEPTLQRLEDDLNKTFTQDEIKDIYDKAEEARQKSKNHKTEPLKDIVMHSGKDLAKRLSREEALSIAQGPDKRKQTPYAEQRLAEKTKKEKEELKKLTAEQIMEKAEINVANPNNSKERDLALVQYTNKVVDSGVADFTNRLLLATPTLGSIRMEWAAARYGMAVPSNFSKVDMQQYMSSFIPIRYTIADAQNMIINEAVQSGYEWLLLIEDDTIPPPDGLIRFNEYIRHAKYPVVSGLYFTRSDPSDPMVYRGRGNSFYTKWKLGDLVWADGVPTGMLLLSCKLLKLMWIDAPEYMCGEFKVKRVMNTPLKTWFNEESGAQETLTGTSDLDFCTRVIEGDYLTKAGWPELAKKKYPFLIDTNLYCKHIDRLTGTQYPLTFPPEFLPEE